MEGVVCVCFVCLVCLYVSLHCSFRYFSSPVQMRCTERSGSSRTVESFNFLKFRAVVRAERVETGEVPPLRTSSQPDDRFTGVHLTVRETITDPLTHRSICLRQKDHPRLLQPRTTEGRSFESQPAHPPNFSLCFPASRSLFVHSNSEQDVGSGSSNRTGESIPVFPLRTILGRKDFPWDFPLFIEVVDKRSCESCGSSHVLHPCTSVLF